MITRRMDTFRTALAGRAFRPRFARNVTGRFGRGLRFHQFLGAWFTMFARLAARAARLVAGTTAAAANGAAATTAAATTTAVAGFQRCGLESGDLDTRDGGADQLLNRLDQATFERCGKRERMSGLAGAAGATDAMHVIFRRERHVVIEDMAHVLNVEAARGHVRSHQNLNVAGLELLQRLRTGGLAHVAMQRTGIEAVLLQGGVQGSHVALAVAEHDGVLYFLALDERQQRVALVVLGYDDQTLDDVGAGRGRRRDGDFLGVAEEAVGQPLDLRRHGGREEQGLTQRRQRRHDALDVGNEPHVEHAVGFVDHQDLDVIQQNAATLEVIEQAAGGGDQHVDTALQCAFLVGEADAADQQCHIELVVLAVGLEVFGYLGGQFARRLQNERARHARLGAALRENIDHRQDETGGLSGARLGASEDVASHQNDGNGLFLDRGGRGVAFFGDCLQYRGAQPQTLKTHLISVV